MINVSLIWCFTFLERDEIPFQMEERIEEVTTITDNDDLRDGDVLEFKRTRRVPFPEYGMDIIDRECFDFPFEYYLYVQKYTENHF